MELTSAELSALDADAQRIGAFFRLATDPIVRLWLGVGPINPGVNALDLTGQTYRGLGELLNLPEFQHLLNGQAERVEFSLSGVSDEVLALASAESNNVQGKACDVGIGIFDSDWQLLGAVKWMWRGYADYLSITRSPAQTPDGQTVQTVALSVGSLMTGRRRRAFSYFTDQDQQARSPGDLFFERTPIYSDNSKTWPRF